MCYCNQKIPALWHFSVSGHWRFGVLALFTAFSAEFQISINMGAEAQQ
jgi:hypothetical protein